MIRIVRPLALAAAALSAVSGAYAAQATVNFNTFYDTSTLFNRTDTKTLDVNVAVLKLVDVDGGVKGTLTFNDTAFPAGTKGLSIDELWLADSTRGTVTKESGDPLKGTYFKHGFYAEGNRYNYDIQYQPNSFKEGETSSFTIKGNGVSVASFVAGADVGKTFMLEVSGVGKPYSGFLGLNQNVHFIGSYIPEPASYALMGLGLVGMSLVARRRSSTKA